MAKKNRWAKEKNRAKRIARAKTRAEKAIIRLEKIIAAKDAERRKWAKSRAQQQPPT